MIEKQNKKPSYWLKAVSHLRSNDPVLSSLINKHRSKIYLVSVNSVFITLIKIIIGQQISIEVADAIENKIKMLLGKVNPKKILPILKIIFIKKIKLHYLVTKNIVLKKEKLVMM